MLLADGLRLATIVNSAAVRIRHVGLTDRSKINNTPRDWEKQNNFSHTCGKETQLSETDPKPHNHSLILIAKSWRGIRNQFYRRKI